MRRSRFGGGYGHDRVPISVVTVRRAGVVVVRVLLENGLGCRFRQPRGEGWGDVGSQVGRFRQAV